MTDVMEEAIVLSVLAHAPVEKLVEFAMATMQLKKVSAQDCTRAQLDVRAGYPHVLLAKKVPETQVQRAWAHVSAEAQEVFENTSKEGVVHAAISWPRRADAI
jgi:hypothetical protein